MTVLGLPMFLVEVVVNGCERMAVFLSHSMHWHWHWHWQRFWIGTRYRTSSMRRDILNMWMWHRRSVSVGTYAVGRWRERPRTCLTATSRRWWRRWSSMSMVVTLTMTLLRLYTDRLLVKMLASRHGLRWMRLILPRLLWSCVLHLHWLVQRCIILFQGLSGKGRVS